MIKRIYHILSLVALTHLFALLGLLGYLWYSGRLTEERVNQIASVLRGELPAEVPATQPATAEPPPIASAEDIERMRDAREYRSLMAVRSEDERADRESLHGAIWLKTVRLQEELEQAKQRFEAEKAAFYDETEQQGFERALKMLASIEPEQAKDILLKGGQFKEAEVVRLMMKMSSNRAKSIINACQSEQELLWIGRILNQIHDMNTEPANGVDGPGVASAGGAADDAGGSGDRNGR